ncbi:unnamed protein product [Cuscuta epithymum]|uniref:Uncharacterized protein n=1 Tax=Cuscuta epithymum TaxID=186058 RepID=A0AAV0E7R7_9ASTE|nr:unnamed protein product [Cuscuta epithymum]
MVAVVEARQLSFPKPPPLSLSLSSPHVTSLLFEPTFLSLALSHSDSSFSLYHSFSPLSLPPPFSIPPPKTLVPPPVSSATFLILRDANPNPNSLFIASSPLSGGSAVLLRFYILSPARKAFIRARVICNHSDIRSEEGKFGVVFGVSHGVSVKLAGSVNVFAMYSISNSKIWVFSVKHLGNDEVKLMKCAVIDCSMPVFSMSLSFGFLIMGEENGVRVLPLRPLIKGTAKKDKGLSKKNTINALERDSKMGNKRVNLQNGTSNVVNGFDSKILFTNRAEIAGSETELKLNSSSHFEKRSDQHSHSAKLKCAKLRQDSGGWGVSYFAFEQVDNLESVKVPIKSVKAISIQALSASKFLILDSVGNLRILFLATYAPGYKIHGRMKRLSLTLRVQRMAVLPDNSASTQAVWLSDGLHSIHVMVLNDTESSVSEIENKETDEMQTSVPQAIFSSEIIQEIAPVTANSAMLLGQGSIFVYAIS